MSMLQISMIILHWTLLDSKFIHDNLFFHTHLSQYSQGCFTMNIKQLCQLKCMSVCNGNGTNHKYANFNLPAWFNHYFECIESNKSYGEFPKLYYTSFYEMPEILVNVRKLCNTFSLTSTSRVRGGTGVCT